MTASKKLSRAIEYLEEHVVRPTFFDRLSDYGIVVKNAAHANSLLTWATILTKYASRMVPVGCPAPLQTADDFIKSAASDELLSDPMVKQAALTVIDELSKEEE